MSKIAINCKTHFSLLNGFSKCDELAKRAKELGYTSCVLADMKTISGAVDFHSACKKHGIKPIIGCDFGDYMLIAINHNGWFDVISCVSDQTIDGLKSIASNRNVICISDNETYRKIFDSSFIKYDYTADAVYYVFKEDAECHRILLCSAMKTTIPKIKKRLKTDEEFDNRKFFESDRFYLHAPKDNNKLDRIEDMCEEYEVARNPVLPAFATPKNMSQSDYLRHLCREGWKSRIMTTNKIDDKEMKKIYADRVKRELDVILKADLSGYFLIVGDIVNEVKRRGWLPGPGRGCFLPDTRVKMSNGLMKTISDIKIGDSVIDCDGNAKKVYDILVYDVDEEIIELHFGKIVIRCTKDHKFLTTNRGWVEAENLTNEDDIVEV